MHPLPPEQRRPHRVVTWLADEEHRLLRVIAAHGSGTASAALRQLVNSYAHHYVETLPLND